MFKLVATIILSLNGAPVGEPLKVTNKLDFETMAACEDFKGSEKAAGALDILRTMLDSRLQPGVTHTETVACEAKADDGSI